MGLLTAAEMHREARLIYESIVSGDAPGYTEREWSELLTQAQTSIIDKSIEDGIDKNETNRRIVSKLIVSYSQSNTQGAYLTGGTSAESTPATWAAVTDGSFRIEIDGTYYNIDGIDFTGDVTMDDVASTIQTAIRTVTSGLEIVTWDTDHFIIQSGIITPDSDITVTTTSTGTVGTDISGLGLSDWLDTDAGTITQVSIKEMDNYTDVYEVLIPSNYYHILSKKGKLTGSSYYAKIVPYAHDAYMTNKNNPFKKPYINDNNEEGELWELIFGDDSISQGAILLVVPSGEIPEKIIINYIKQPSPIIVPYAYTTGTIEGLNLSSYTTGLDCKLDVIAHRKIVRKAADLAAAYSRDRIGYQMQKIEGEDSPVKNK